MCGTAAVCMLQILFSLPSQQTTKKMKREIANLIVQLTPWEMRIKKIESWFGLLSSRRRRRRNYCQHYRSVWIRRRVVLHVLAVDLLDQHIHKVKGHLSGLCA